LFALVLLSLCLSPADGRLQHFFVFEPVFTEDSVHLAARAHVVGKDDVLNHPTHHLNTRESVHFQGHVFNFFDFTNWNAHQTHMRFLFRYTVEHEGAAFASERVRVKVTFRDNEVRLTGEGETHRFSKASIQSGAALARFFAALVAPKGPVRLKIPDSGDFALRLEWREQETERKVWPLAVREISGHFREHLHTLAATLCVREGTGRPSRVLPFEVPSRLGEASSLFEQMATHRLPPEDLVPLCEAYLAFVPSDRNGWATLVNGYLAQDREDLAMDVVHRLGPLLDATTKRVTEFRYDRKVADLLADADAFASDPEISIRFSAPMEDGVITKNNLVRFDIEGQRARMIELTCLLNGKPVATVQDDVTEIRFHNPYQSGTHAVTLEARFFDGTMSQASVTVTAMYVDLEENLYATEIRAVASHANDLLTDLGDGDFEVFFQGAPVPVLRFQKEIRPLDVVILLDISESMANGRIARSRKAISAFLDELGPKDRAALLAFNRMVLRVQPFTEDLEALEATMLGLDPRQLTSLYDGLLIARDDLREARGVPVIVVISDGNDMASWTGREEMLARLRESSVMVHSIVLGSLVAPLEELAKATGSTYTRLTRMSDLDARMLEIHQELKQYYTFAIHTPADVRMEDLEIRLRDRPGEVRFRILEDR